MYLCQTLYVFLTPSLLPSMSPITSIDLCLFPPSFHPMLLYFLPLPLSFLYCRWNSRFVLPWRRRGTEDGWEDGRQRDGERERCSLGLVYLINYEKERKNPTSFVIVHQIYRKLRLLYFHFQKCE